MRVGLNLLYFIPGQGGVETFGRELVRALLGNADDGIEYVLYTSLDGQEFLESRREGVKVVICPFHARNRVVRYCWEQFVLPWQVLAHGVDVLHSLAYVGPIVSGVPTVLTVHDANTCVVGRDMNTVRRIVLWNVSRLSARAAKLVATVSIFSRDELLRWYRLRQSDVRVITSGPGSCQANAIAPEGTMVEGMIEGPYIAVIGGTYPHKNISRLVEAFERIADKVVHKLVIIGNISPDAREMINSLAVQNVIVTGYLSSAAMDDVIARSDLFVMPSLYEGFGFPVLEAQAKGIPIACSNAGSLPEVTAASAALFDPENVDDIAGTILRCITDRALNANLRKRSRENVVRYSWDQTADVYLACYRELTQSR